MRLLNDVEMTERRHWRVRGQDISPDLSFREQILLLHGLGPGPEREQFLTQDAHLRLGSLLGDPSSLPDMPRAVDRILLALSAGERICVYGDYDADGVTGTAILVGGLRELGALVEYYIPHRVQSGFGLHPEAIRALAARGVRLLITVDCGTSDLSEVELAAELDVDVIITDHHSLPPSLPTAIAVVNPQRQEGTYPDRRLTGAGVAYTLLRALAYRLGSRTRIRASDMVQLAALGTIADVAPLLGENRLLVQAGLVALNRAPLPGIRALRDASGLVNTRISESDISFKLAPRINAAGRMAHSELACELLLTDDPVQARQLAAQLEQLNNARRDTTDAMLAVAEQMVDTGSALRGDALTVYSEDWSPALLGIVAGRLSKTHCLPVVAATLSAEGVVRASARSVPGLDITAALDGCSHLLSEHGGHAQAAGFSTTLDGLKAVHQHLIEQFAGTRGAIPTEVDVELDAEDLSPQLVADLDALSPFGAGNPEPVLGLHRVRARGVRIFGKQRSHVSFVVPGAGGTGVEVVGFGMSDESGLIGSGGNIDLVVRPLRQQNGSYRPLRLALEKAFRSMA